MSHSCPTRRAADLRENQQVERWLMTAQRRRWRLFHNHMGIGAAHAERAHAGAPRPLRSRPMAQLGIHVKRAAREIDPWIGSGKVDLRWRSEEHTSELQSLMRISYACF